MLGINDILLDKINVLGWTEEQRFKYLQSCDVDVKVIEYLRSKFEGLTIEVLGDYQGNIMQLMKMEKLEGWCWQTTESAIVFLNDDDYILRGILKFNKYKDYFHSWIVFKFDNIEYVFDPCLNLLCKKSIYDKVFEIVVKGKVLSKEVRETLIDFINCPEKDNYNSLISEDIKQVTERVMINLFGEDYNRRRKDEFIISGNDDVNSPMFRNYTGYKVELEGGDVRKLVAHYYLGC